MEVIIDLLLAVKSILTAFVVSWFRFFFASYNKKCVKGEIVLITGSGERVNYDFKTGKSSDIITKPAFTSESY